MKNIKNFLKKKNTHTPAFHDKDQQWDHWAAQIIIDLVFAFENYKKEHPEYNPKTDDYDPKWFDEIIKWADKNMEIWDIVHCLYECYYNGDFNMEDVNLPGDSKVKFFS